ncbi:MAG TPA: LON peptidase substrate-binding domain-containing protein, partial [Gemmatimonadaceae bacterium]|nr:LON peptidase substrate-binding domain-containing protein [Gemmatimonadaceae bacterium]
MSPRRLPLFPLPLVLLPGVTTPLHIFEPRYRRLLADCLAGDRRFGLIYLPRDTAEDDLPRGHVGTVAAIEASDPLPDGRSNILVRGTERFALSALVPADAPYHVGEVDAFDDEPEPSEPMTRLAEHVRERFAQVATAARALADDRAPVPALEDAPALLAFRIASLIDMDAAARQRLLASRSPTARLREIGAVLERAAAPLERRAAVHTRAKTN